MNQAKFTDEANEDLRDAMLWYENQQKGVGKKFANEVIEKVRKLEKKPDMYSSEETGLRKTSLKAFPYFIYYVIKIPIVLIIAVWHKSRLKDTVNKRVSNVTEKDGD